MQGLVKLDAPTVQRTTFYVFLQLTLSLGWELTTAVGDIKNAFLQGQNRAEAGSPTSCTCGSLRGGRCRASPLDN